MISSPSRLPTKKLKIAEEKNVASSSQPKNPKLSENVSNSSNLQRSSHRLAHQFDFSNPFDDPIGVEEVEGPSQEVEKGPQARMIHRILVVHLIRHRQQKTFWMKGPPPSEKAIMSILLSLLPLRFVLHLYLSLVFFFYLVLYFPFFRLHRDQFSIQAEMDLSLDLSFPDQTTPTP